MGIVEEIMNPAGQVHTRLRVVINYKGTLEINPKPWRNR